MCQDQGQVKEWLDKKTVLLIAYDFPPANTPGSIRMGHLASWLSRHGAQVATVTATDPSHPRNPACEPESAVITSAVFKDPRHALTGLWQSRPQIRQPKSLTRANKDRPVGSNSWKGKLKAFLRDVLAVPDSSILWYPGALIQSLAVARRCRPDVVISSSPPFTSHMVGRHIARRLGVPWVADMRDGFTDNPYVFRSHWRRRLDEQIEKRVLSAANVIPTVSVGLVKSLSSRFGENVVLIRNGFTHTDTGPETAHSATQLTPDKLNILHTGSLYSGHRDPSQLFLALRSLGDEAGEVRVHFYGVDSSVAADLAAKHQIQDSVFAHGHVTRQESLSLQRKADVLLLILGESSDEHGVVTSKIFEYLAAERPILLLGYSKGEAMELLNMSGRGVSCRDVDELSEFLRTCLKQWRSGGSVQLSSQPLTINLDREAQWSLLFGHLSHIQRGI